MSRTLSYYFLDFFLDDQNFFCVIDFAKLDFNNFLLRRLYFAAHEAGFDGKLTMAAVDQYAELDLVGTSLLKKRIHGGSHGTPGVENVIDQHDVLARDRKFHLGFLYNRSSAHGREIVTIQGDIKRTHGHLSLLDTTDHLSQPLREEYSASTDSDQAEAGCTIIFLDDFVDQSHQRAFDFGRGHQLRLLADVGLAG